MSPVPRSVVDATQYPDFCIQGALSRECPVVVPPPDLTSTGPGTGDDRGGAGSEDCLKVNIYTPSKASAGSNCEPVVPHSALWSEYS